MQRFDSIFHTKCATNRSWGFTVGCTCRRYVTDWQQMLMVAKWVDTGGCCTRKYAKNRATDYRPFAIGMAETWVGFLLAILVCKFPNWSTLGIPRLDHSFLAFVLFGTFDGKNETRKGWLYLRVCMDLNETEVSGLMILTCGACYLCLRRHKFAA